MNLKKKEKEFLWLKVLHLLEDENLVDNTNVNKVLKELNKKFFIKERKFKIKKK